MTTASSAESQFKSYKSVVSKDQIDLVPVLDIERCTKGHPMDKLSLQRHVKKWCKLCKQHYGVYPILYCSREFYLKHFKEKFNSLLFWCGDVNATRSYVDKVNWTIWQYSISLIPGIQGKVDVNQLHPDASLETIKMK